MDNFILVTDGRALAQVEQLLQTYLPGLDARLFPFSPHQAILRATLLRALAIDYPSISPREMLRQFGVATLKPVSGEASAQILSGRDAIDLPPRPVAPAPAAPHDWHLDAVAVPAAWQLLGGPDQIGWRTRVGQIDTGYTRHPVFGFPDGWLMVAQAASFFPPPADAGLGLPTELGAGLDNGVGVSAGHGTRIASVLCGRDALAGGGGFLGVAPRVPLVPVRITDVVWINHAQREFEAAVMHLIAQQVGVINISLGVFLGAMAAPLRRAVNAAYEAGVLLVCAAGNFVNAVVGPASLARTLAVAGVTRADTPWSGSSFGPEVDFSAPAADLRRASVEGVDQFSYGAGGDGTSYAAAITAGVAALWLSHRADELAASYPQAWQRIEAFRTLARHTARVPAGWQQGAFGHGILDAAALLSAPLPSVGSLQAAEAA